MTDMQMKPLLFSAAAGLAAAVVLAAPAAADAVEDFYKGKKMTIIIGGTPGGGYDVYARQLARFIGNYIPGKPGIISQNMQGAGSIRAANYVYNVARKDGTIMGAVQRTIPLLPLYGAPGLQYDPLKFNWIGSLNNEISVCVSRKDSGVATLADAQQKQLIIGGSGANDTENFPAVLNNLLGTKFKIVSGYKGPDIALAMERNEVQGRCGWSWSSLKNQHSDWIKNGTINILIQLSVEKLDEIKAPFVMDLAKNEEQRDVLELVFAPQAFGRPFMMPPDVPAERVKAVRDAFTKAATDEKLIKDLERVKFDLALVSGERMQTLIAKLLKTPRAVIDKAADTMKYKGERLKAKIVEVNESGAITKVVKKGRSIEVKMSDGATVKAPLSRSRSKVTIAGKAAKREDLKEGMTCTLTYAQRGLEASKVVCK
jgi:tripartite-type tricarboxylate transporter receptor subunit TctC